MIVKTSPPTGKAFTSLQWWVILIPFLIFLVHAFMFQGWIIDDAGISLAYARNLATGHGLVDQPGNPPVEGFSNFLWVLLLSPLFLFRDFSPLVTPKIISILLILLTFLVFFKIWRMLPSLNLSSLLLCLSFTSLNTSFVVWTTSGLENALYVFLISYLCYLTLIGIFVRHFSFLRSFSIGIIAGLIAFTRPDGVLYIVFFPFMFLIFCDLRERKFIALIPILAFFLSFFLIYGSYFIFRLIYFKDIFPNTYYAKGGPTIVNILAILTFQPSVFAKYSGLIISVAGILGNLISLGILFITYKLIKDNKLQLEYICLLVIACLCTLNYLLLPQDWMGEFRFATPFIIFFYASVFMLINLFLINSHGKLSFVKVSFIAVIISSIILNSINFYHRSTEFSKHKIVNFSTLQYAAFTMNKFCDLIEVKNASWLTPDIGGPLYSSKLRIYDLAGLCDRTIAKTLKGNKTRDNFHDYIFEKVKPTIINTHGHWAWLAQFDKDPRFRRDYFPLQEQVDLFASEPGPQIMSGYYFRKDATENASVAISKFQKLFR